MSASWKNLRNIPAPPGLSTPNSPMEPPKARAIHFIGDSRRLIASFLDHGIVYDQGTIVLGETHPLEGVMIFRRCQSFGPLSRGRATCMCFLLS